MIKQYFQQAWAQLRQQPLISAVTVAGTALSIFLIMLVVMMQQVKVAPFSPESNRDRFLHVKWGSITNEAWGESTSNGPLSVRTAREVYGKMTTPEAVTIYSVFSESRPVSLPEQPAISVDVRETDYQFWTVFDFAFIDGKPYDQATFDAGQPVAVITESVARHLFKTTQVTGKDVWADCETQTEKRYPAEINDKYSLLKYSLTFDKPLYGIVTLDHNGLSMKGTEAKFLPPTPSEIGLPEKLGSFPLVSFIKDVFVDFKN